MTLTSTIALAAIAMPTANLPLVKHAIIAVSAARQRATAISTPAAKVDVNILEMVVRPCVRPWQQPVMGVMSVAKVGAQPWRMDVTFAAKVDVQGWRQWAIAVMAVSNVYAGALWLVLMYECKGIQCDCIKYLFCD